jgi:3-methyladenine DNA glycosylase AlkD
MATLAVHDKEKSDREFEKFFFLIKKESIDERNFVKKAVNWALRQIGKRSAYLNRLAVKTAEMIQKRNSKATRWVAADALRELTSEAVQKRLHRQRS